LTFNSESHLIIVPTYNEIENISEFINQVTKLDISLLVVDDNSPDGTGTYVENIMKSIPNIFIFKRESKLGLGSAYREGFQWGISNGFSYFIEMDADFSHSFIDLKKILSYSENSDVVIGSRYVSGGGSTGWDKRRKLLSATANKISQLLLRSSIYDMTSGFRCYSKNSLEKINYSNTKSDGYSFQIEMTLRCIIKNLSIKEVPIIFNERRLGNSKMSKSIVMEALLFLLSNGIKRWLNLKIN
jgi:dolichol-phosphate mannosyltransferase